MKKHLLLTGMLALTVFCSSGQLIYDHGPIVNQPGAGSGGADVSALHNNLNSFGFRSSLTATLNYRIADSFIVPANENWTIDSVIVYSYQSLAGTTSTTVSSNCAIYNGAPNAGGTIILGDQTTNLMNATYWTGIYRTTATAFTNTDRAVIANRLVPTSAWNLSAGSYWISYQVEGSASFSGPWSLPITFPVQTITGSALQYNGSAWANVIDTAATGAADDAPQGFPFRIYGSIITGVNTLSQNPQVSIFPNPVHTTAQVKISRPGANTGAALDFKLYDAIGREVLSVSGITKSEFTISRSGLSNGMYYFHLLENNRSILSDKLIIQ